MLTGVTKKDRIGMIIDQMALRTMATARLIEIMSRGNRSVRERTIFARFTLAQIKMLVKGAARRASRD
jgi:hypothetical protein